MNSPFEYYVNHYCYGCNNSKECNGDMNKLVMCIQMRKYMELD